VVIINNEPEGQNIKCETREIEKIFVNTHNETRKKNLGRRDFTKFRDIRKGYEKKRQRRQSN